MTIRRDPNGQPMTIGFNGSEHFFLYNAQGDVVAIANYSGEIVVEYTYDAWGNPLSCTGSMADTLGKKNPFRYRGYVYDEETGLYYLKSRYYDPRVGRFICADKFTVSNPTITGSNIIAYCDNNPITRIDGEGTSWDEAWASHKAGETIARMTPEELQHHINILNMYAQSYGKDLYAASRIAQVERGRDVYVTYKDGGLIYRSSDVYWGGTHHVNIPLDIPKDQVIAASFHTHPYTDSFSEIDVNNAASLNMYNYVIGASELLQRCSPQGTIAPVAQLKIDYPYDRQMWVALSKFGKIQWDLHAEEAMNRLGKCNIGFVNTFWAGPDDYICTFTPYY